MKHQTAAVAVPNARSSSIVDRDALARRWAQAIGDAGYVPKSGAVPMSGAAMLEFLRGLVERLADAPAAEPFDAGPGRQVGTELVEAEIAGSDTLGRTIEILGAGLGRPDDGRQPQLIGALAGGGGQPRAVAAHGRLARGDPDQCDGSPRRGRSGAARHRGPVPGGVRRLGVRHRHRRPGRASGRRQRHPRRDVSASIGIVDRVCATTTPAELMRAADITLYWAKVDGKRKWAVFDSERTDREVARYEMSASMPGALRRGEFVLDYQPLVLCGGETVIGAEALVRWRHPRLGRLAPDRFVGLAEETGMIVPLGLWVLEEACRQGGRVARSRRRRRAADQRQPRRAAGAGAGPGR